MVLEQAHMGVSVQLPPHNRCVQRANAIVQMHVYMYRAAARTMDAASSGLA